MDAGWKTWIGQDSWAVLVRGELDVESGPRLRDFLAAELARQERACVVDLSKVTFIDSSGLHALVASLRRAQLLGRPFTLVLDAAGRVERLLEMTGLGALFDVRPVAKPVLPAVSGLAARTAPDRPVAAVELAAS